MIKSRFGFIIYLVFFIVAAFWSFPAYLIFHPNTVVKSRLGDDNSATALGVFLLFFGAVLGFIYLRILYIIKVENEIISVKGLFKNKRIVFSDIQVIDLFSKEDFYWTAGMVGIATRISLNNGENIIVGDFFYRNIHIVKQAIAENFKEKLKPLPFEKQNYPTQIDIESDSETFSGNPHTSFNGIMMYGMLIFFVSIMFAGKVQLKAAHLALLFPALIFYGGFGMQLNYFLLSNKRLIVKNHFLFWINKTYDLNDIAVVDFERPYRRSNTLRIVTTDFKSKLFSAGSLRDKRWAELKEKLKGLQVNFIE